MREEEWEKKEAALRAELQRVVEESGVKDERIRELEEKNKELERREKECKRELQSLLVSNAELEEQCGKWEDECSVLKGEEWKARMEIDMLMRKEEEVEMRFTDLERAFAKLGTDKRMVEEELEDWKGRCKRLEEDFQVVRGEVEKMKEHMKGLLEELNKKGELSGCYTEAELKFGEVGSRTKAPEKEKEENDCRCTKLEASRKKTEEDNNLIFESGRQSRGEMEGPKGKFKEMFHKLDQNQVVNQQPSALNSVAKIDTSINLQPRAQNLVPKTETRIECIVIEKRHSAAAGGPQKFVVIDISDSDEEVDASPAPLLTSTGRMSNTLNTLYDMGESLPQGASTNLTERTPNLSLKMPMLETRVVASNNDISSSNECHILSPKLKLLAEEVAVDENDEGAHHAAGRASNSSGLGDLVQTLQPASSNLTEATSKISANGKKKSIKVKKNVGPSEEDDRILSPKRRRFSKVISDGESDEDEDHQNSTRRTMKLLKDLLASNEHDKLTVDPAALNDGKRLARPLKKKDYVRASPLLVEVDTAGCDEEIGTSKSPITATRKHIHLLLEREEMRNTKRASSVVSADEGDCKDVKSTSSITGEFILENRDKENDTIGRSEIESLDGFIVNGSGGLEAESTSYSSASGADDDFSFHDSLSHILGRNQRKKGPENWEFEADMLASFQKDDELCMKAVCALYRQQTFEEKAGKASLYHNHWGFNILDALRLRGSEIAEFLTDGDPFGPLKKSAKELERHNPEGVEYCRELAMRYSKQLFEIYQKQEDPFFCPSS